MIRALNQINGGQFDIDITNAIADVLGRIASTDESCTASIAIEIVLKKNKESYEVTVQPKITASYPVVKNGRVIRTVKGDTTVPEALPPMYIEDNQLTVFTPKQNDAFEKTIPLKSVK